jgi:hypothetical protein
MSSRTPPRPSLPRVPTRLLRRCISSSPLPTLGRVSTVLVNYNEDLSAFHGSTLTLRRPTRPAPYPTYSRYAHQTHPPIVVMNHSMGGVVATSLLPSPNISAAITMSTPYQFPPARFDRRITAIYDHNQAALAPANTPMLSLCGGATDLVDPLASESCILPDAANTGVYRRTVFSSIIPPQSTVSSWIASRVTGAHRYLSCNTRAASFESDHLHCPPSGTHRPTGFARAESCLPRTSFRVRFADEIRGLCRRVSHFRGTLPFFFVICVFLYMLIHD